MDNLQTVIQYAERNLLYEPNYEPSLRQCSNSCLHRPELICLLCKSDRDAFLLLNTVQSNPHTSKAKVIFLQLNLTSFKCSCY